jgi:hypothetical protein
VSSGSGWRWTIRCRDAISAPYACAARKLSKSDSPLRPGVGGEPPSGDCAGAFSVLLGMLAGLAAPGPGQAGACGAGACAEHRREGRRGHRQPERGVGLADEQRGRRRALHTERDRGLDARARPDAEERAPRRATHARGGGKPGAEGALVSRRREERLGVSTTLATFLSPELDAMIRQNICERARMSMKKRQQKGAMITYEEP